MVVVSMSIREDYWDDFELQAEDVDFLYAHLLEVETPLTPNELIKALVIDRIQRELKAIEVKRLSGGSVYLPQDEYKIKQSVVFPALDWRQAEVVNKRDGYNPDLGEFSVIEVKFENGEVREFASALANHPLNMPEEVAESNIPSPDSVLRDYDDILIERLEEGLQDNADFVCIAGRWFPRSLLVDVNTGHLNLAEALLDIESGGPLPTSELLKQIELSTDENPKLVEFSLDLALQEDKRFDEVGPAGKVLWFLHRLEPEGVQVTPDVLRYTPIECERSNLTPEMLELEQRLDDEWALENHARADAKHDVAIPLLYAHWRAGTLPLTRRIGALFPTAYEAPRILFTLIDGETGENFPGWVVRKGGYVFGLEKWYRDRELMPGSIVIVRAGQNKGEVVVDVEAQRSRRDWVRTALVGADGGIVFATLKQMVSAVYDERMGIMIPDIKALDSLWEKRQKQPLPFERVVADVARELTKLNPQNHVHVSELYAAVNLVRRCPPGPVMTLLASRPWFVHVGDLHFRFDDSAGS